MEGRSPNPNNKKELFTKSWQYSIIIFILLLICNILTSSLYSENTPHIDFESVLILLILSFIVGGILSLGRWIIKRYKCYLHQQTSIEEGVIEDKGPVQVRTLVLPYNYEMSFYLCMESISFLKSAYIKKADSKEGTIIVRVGMSWKSFGEKITFLIKPLGNGELPQTLVKIESKPVLPTTLYDYGKNRENVQTITQFLNVINKVSLHLKK